MELADSIARQAHAGQTDKGGHPYIEHPRAVAAQLDDPFLKAAALLHDVVEDTDWTVDALGQAGMDPAVIEIVTTLTHRNGESYWDYLRRVRLNPQAVPVKVADLTHNSQIDRIPRPSRFDFMRLEKYRKAMAYLLAPSAAKHEKKEIQ